MRVGMPTALVLVVMMRPWWTSLMSVSMVAI